MSCKLVVYLAVLIGYVQAYGSGAPPAACATMEPAPGAHPDNTVPEGDLPPYELMAMPLEGGRRVMVFLRSIQDAPFRGLMIMAAKADSEIDHRGYGYFEVSKESASDARPMNCENMDFCNECQGKANAVTHTDGSKDKTGATFVWNAPGDMANEKIVFIATVVKGRAPTSEWYSGIKSNVVNI